MALRKIKPIGLKLLTPGGADMPPPRFETVNPEDLLVDDTYQRGLADRSIRLIRKIVANWDWRSFKPPVVVEVENGFHVIDGQHTSIAAASHPLIQTIPVMVVDASTVEVRARAFLGHNVDRVGVTPTQLFIAEVAAKDTDALAVQQVCEKAGVRILKTPPGSGYFKPGDTMAVASIKSLVRRKGPQYAGSVLRALVKASCAPIQASFIRAADMLLTDPPYRGTISVDDLTTVIMTNRDTAIIEAKMMAAKTNQQLWKALGVFLHREFSRGRARAA